MKQIKLTKGKFAIIDDEYFEYLNKWKWHLSDQGYAIRTQHIKIGFKKYKNKHIRLHRLINNTPDDMFTDHINRDKLDCRKENLRSVTKSQNGINRSKQNNNHSGFKGICWNEHAKKWMVEIKVKPTKIYLGIYKNLEEAIEVRKEAERRYHVI
jgi:hypothetical protein